MSSKKPHITTMPISALVEDMDVYPRHAVDGTHVQTLMLALESGAQLPPIVADKKSKRIADGWHRARAYTRLHGPTATADVELIDYASEADMIFDAVQRNSRHGRKLDVIDQTRSIIMLERNGISRVRIAVALHVPEKRVEKLAIKVAETRSPVDGNVPGTKRITLKRSVSHLRGSVLTKEQAEAHKSMPGTSFLLVARQLTKALQTGLVDLGDERLVAQLRTLASAIGKALANSTE